MRVMRLMRGVGLGLAAACLTAVACRGAAKPAPRPTDDCRAIARHGRGLIDASAPPARDDVTRLIASLIDLCQSPGLAASTRTCVLGAQTVATLRGCPSLTEVLGDATGDDGAPSCHAAVDHAMQLLEGDGSRPRTRDARAEARSAYLDGCVELSPGGRRCVAEAPTIAAVDDCFADPALSAAPSSR